ARCRKKWLMAWRWTTRLPTSLPRTSNFPSATAGAGNRPFQWVRGGRSKTKRGGGGWGGGRGGAIGCAGSGGVPASRVSPRAKKMVNGMAVDNTFADVIASHKQLPIRYGGRENETFRVVAERKLKTEAGAECVVVVTEVDYRFVRYRSISCFLDLSADRKLTA